MKDKLIVGKKYKFTNFLFDGRVLIGTYMECPDPTFMTEYGPFSITPRIEWNIIDEEAELPIVGKKYLIQLKENSKVLIARCVFAFGHSVMVFDVEAGNVYSLDQVEKWIELPPELNPKTISKWVEGDKPKHSGEYFIKYFDGIDYAYGIAQYCDEMDAWYMNKLQIADGEIDAYFQFNED